MDVDSLDVNLSKRKAVHTVVEESYELLPLRNDAERDTTPRSGTHLPEQTATSHYADHMDNEGGEPDWHLPAVRTAGIQQCTPVPNGGHLILPPSNHLTGTLVHSCLGCIGRLRFIERQLNERNFDTLQLFDDQSYATDIELQLKEGQQFIPISFIGRHNAGKSTLINAILGDELLPQRVMNETGIRVYIQDNPDCHRGPCLDPSGKCSRCPVLVPFPKGTNVSGDSCRYQGKKAIKHALHTFNQESRSRTEEEVGHYLLLVNVPILRNSANITSGQQVYLVDTPGLGDSNTSIAELAEKSALTSPAYVYVMNYLSLEDGSDSNTIARMYGKDAKLLEENRFAIAVTQYDRFFQDAGDDESDDSEDVDGTSLNDEAMQADVKNRVCKQLENKLEVPIPHDLIFLVSGMWALKARNKRGSQLRKYLESYSRKATCSVEAPSDTAEHLLASSGVGVLERRIWEIVQKCYASWIQNMKGNCLSYLRHAISEIQGAICKHRDIYDVWKAQSDAEQALYDNVLQAKDALRRTLSTTDPVYHYLKGSCRDEFHAYVLRDVAELIGTEANRLRSTLIAKIARKYTPDDLKKDLNQFLEEFSENLEERFSDVTLETVFSCHHRIDRDMKEQYEKMLQNSHLLCHGSIHSHLPDRVQSSLGSYSSETIRSHRIMEDSCRENPLKLPELLDEIVVKPFKFSRARQVLWIMRGILHLLRYGAPSEDLWKDWRSHCNEFRLKRRISSSQSTARDRSEDQPDGTYGVEGTTGSEMGSGLPDLRNYSQQTDEDLSEDQEDNTLEAEGIKYSEMDIVTPPERMLSQDQVTDVVEQLKILIHTELQKYAENLAERIAMHFFEVYQIGCGRNLDDFNRVMLPELEAVQEKLQKEKVEKEKLLEYMKELEENYKELVELQQDICTKADEALRHLQT